jgi:hypothetical protein
MQKFDKTLRLDHLHHTNRELKRKSDLLYANNFIIGEPRVIGLGLCSKFSNEARANRLSGRAMFVTFDDWQRLYKKYCDASLELRKGSEMRLFKRNILRFMLLVFKRAEDEFRYLKKAYSSHLISVFAQLIYAVLTIRFERYRKIYG